MGGSFGGLLPLGSVIEGFFSFCGAGGVLLLLEADDIPLELEPEPPEVAGVEGCVLLPVWDCC